MSCGCGQEQTRSVGKLQRQVARLEAANAALAAALRYAKPFFEKGGDAWNLIDAALSDTGECDCGPAELGPHPASDHKQGWLPPEVREQARLAIGHAFHLIEHNKAMCVRCREAKQRLSTALAELEVK